MCRPLITLLRRVGVHSFLPLDLHVSYHQSCGVLLAILSVLHTICHLGNLEMNLIPDTANNPANYTTIQWLLSSDKTSLGTIRGQRSDSSQFNNSPLLCSRPRLSYRSGPGGGAW